MATIPLGLYLWRRIHEVGVESIMGLPGDFNLNFLDHIYDVPGLRFIGNSNELNAAYAADGYARVKRTPGCLVTTHGVGELSALNGIACAASERSSVIHVVGQISRPLQEARLMVHHSIGPKPDHQIFNKCSEPIRCGAAELHKGLDQAPAAIDKAIRDCVLLRQPVYIFFPIDMTNEQVPASLLDAKIDLSPPVNKANEDAVVEEIMNALYTAKTPAVLVDYLTYTHGRGEAQGLVKKLDLPFYTTHGSKGAVDETHPKFVGLYNAWASTPGLAKSIESRDLVVTIGWFNTDLLSCFFSRSLPEGGRIDIMDDHVLARGKRYDSVYMAPLLSRLRDTIDSTLLAQQSVPGPFSIPDAPDQHASHITQSQIWRKLSTILKPGDVLHADTGTPAYGCVDMPFPSDVQFIYSCYYGSIGFNTPCALGTDVALRDMHESGAKSSRGRTILITGDGSLMLTMQEIATMVMQKLPILIIVINNFGYTIERAIHGAHQPYNDIPRMDYSSMLALFGAPDPQKRYRKVATMVEVDALVQDEAFLNPVGAPHVLEVIMDKMDIPWKMGAVLNKRSPGYLKETGFLNADWDLITAPEKM